MKLIVGFGVKRLLKVAFGMLKFCLWLLRKMLVFDLMILQALSMYVANISCN